MEKELIYSVEDDDNIRDLIKYTVEEAGFNIECFSNGKDMLEALKNNIPSLILLDIMLPDMEGTDILKIIRTDYAHLPIKVIMLTAKSSEINIVTGLNLGADDYIPKPFSVLELIARIKANLRKKDVRVDTEELTFGEIKLIVKKRVVYVNDRQVSLTQKEFDLLKLLMENANNVVDREMMLEEVWGVEHSMETRTIDMHIKSIRQKLDLKKENIITIRGMGYKLIEI
ncbi:response regulator transcription factor [Brachyspira pilosicoli]|uniref:Transcriptional regulatory protein n=5 Tax=Brachyspira pilosicoli TaxID=52584 RepID=D8IBC6_BRAP9|nr:response regulator transcription factor [Brachyspira pilosicoli]ADK30449.1 transcriptional regulatory protein [Brachyspira pilosicoli 95/1000]AFR70289.1 two component transcriptional regulator, winged helix family [Brachyspira pilosicoli B2904]AGA65517.1 transcriptional regulatory protein [Brachyspira pilosicoli P43/6/78]MBW5377339.1 response regulator transcription factor [Brachyspira pilosicoli]MBW5382379.1 response regulator transcription factor [Brachyspira pilosicoli]